MAIQVAGVAATELICVSIAQQHAVPLYSRALDVAMLQQGFAPRDEHNSTAGLADSGAAAEQRSRKTLQLSVTAKHIEAASVSMAPALMPHDT